MEIPKLEDLEGGKEAKGVLLLLAEALHLGEGPIKYQVGEGGRQEAADGLSKESLCIIRQELLQFG